MANTTPILGLTLPATGDPSWGTVLNSDLTIIDTAVGEKANTASLATVATSGSYNDLSSKPSIPAAQVNSDWNASSGVAQILNQPSLATVATSGSYADLSSKPTIPAAQVQTDWNAATGIGVLLNKPSLATVATSGSYNDLSSTPTIPTVPTSWAWSTITKTPTTLSGYGITDALGLQGKADTAGTADTATNALSLGGALANTYAPLASPTFTGALTAIQASLNELVITALATPVNSAFSSAHNSGSLHHATPYYYRVAATDGFGTTVASAETSTTTGSGADDYVVTVNWAQVAGATGYKVYGRTAGGELLMATIVGGSTLTWIDTGSVTPSGALPAAATTGVIQLGGSTSSYPMLNRSGSSINVKYADNSGFAPLYGSVLGDGAGNSLIGANGALVASGKVFGFSSTSLATGALDTGLSRGGIGVVAVGNGTAADNSGTLKATKVNLAPTTPASSSAAGNQGDIVADANYIYVCTAASTWKRAALATW
jgi:hypothetical protein